MYRIVLLGFLMAAGWIALADIHIARADNRIVSAGEPAHHPESQVSDTVFGAYEFRLDNGLHGIVIPNHRAPVVTHMIWYKTGAADEPLGQSGIAHFLEHLMFKGSGNLAAGEFSKKIKSMAGEHNAFTSYDYTAYFESVPSQHLRTVMEMEAQRMRGLNPPENEVNSELKVIREERRQRIENDPAARLQEEVSAALFVNHPYGRPIIGWGHEMDQLNWIQAKNFYDVWYAPNNAILVVSGDVDPLAVESLAKEIYGPLSDAVLLPRERSSLPVLCGKRQIVLNDASVKQPQLMMAFVAPSQRKDRKSALAMEVLSDILAGGPTARLYQTLVVEQKIAVDVGMSYDGVAWDMTDAVLYAIPAQGHDVHALGSAIEAELRKVVHDGVTAQEVTESIARLQAQAIYARDSLSGPAMIVGQALATGLMLGDVEHWPDFLAQVTAEDVRSAASTYLNPDVTCPWPYVTGVLQGGQP
jgi:zinc protease